MFVRSDPYAQGPVFEHAETAVGYCLCSGESALAENLHVKRNFGESLVRPPLLMCRYELNALLHVEKLNGADPSYTPPFFTKYL